MPYIEPLTLRTLHDLIQRAVEIEERRLDLPLCFDVASDEGLDVAQADEPFRTVSLDEVVTSAGRQMVLSAGR